MSLDLLRGFRAAARHLSFTRAARELHVTQSAISREIKALETQLGQALVLGGFHRVVARRAADRAAVAAFVAWLEEEPRRDEERAPRAIGLAAGSATRGGS